MVLVYKAVCRLRHVPPPYHLTRSAGIGSGLSCAAILYTWASAARRAATGHNLHCASCEPIFAHTGLCMYNWGPESAQICGRASQLPEAWRRSRSTFAEIQLSRISFAADLNDVLHCCCVIYVAMSTLLSK